MSASVSVRPGRRPDPALRDLWQQRLLRFEQSGLPGPAFCAAEGLTLSSLYSWRRRLRPPSPGPDQTPPARLLPVRVQAPLAVELVLPCGLVLRLPQGCDLDFVRSLVASLGGQPC